jgi:hypothetical protein
MNDSRIPKKALQWTAYGKRAVGQLKRWEYSVWKDSTKLSGMQAWKKKAKDRQFWRQHIEEAKA